MNKPSENQQRLNRLQECVGDQKFKELLLNFSGESIYFSGVGTAGRNAEIQQEYERLVIRQGMKSGEAVELLCRQFFLSKSTIYNIITVIPL